MPKLPKVLAISGSTRKQSSNQRILNFLSTRFASRLRMDIYDAIDGLPHFNPDLEKDRLPAVVRDLRQKIDAADGVLFCTPEYVFSLPGSLKNAIEWTVSTTIFSNKPTALLVAAASGEKALESLRLIMTTIEAEILDDSTLLVRGARGKVSESGEITDQDLISRLDVLMESLLTSIREDRK